jgi:lipid II:glycine glycyltransferase (peptidoglycan interpeptide bridge formation enzyme)
MAINPVLGRTADYDPADVYTQQDLYVLDLRSTEDELLARFSRQRRWELRRWERSGGRIVTDPDRLLAFVLREHAEFFRSRRASTAYSFSADTWRLLSQMPNVLLCGATLHDTLTAVTIFAYTPTIGDYLFNISIGACGRNATTPLLWHGVLALRALGVPLLNLGGGIHSDDGVARFKQRFGAVASPLRSLRQVYDQDRFEHLCRNAGADPHDRSGYFPPHRAA